MRLTEYPFIQCQYLSPLLFCGSALHVIAHDAIASFPHTPSIAFLPLCPSTSNNMALIIRQGRIGNCSSTSSTDEEMD